MTPYVGTAAIDADNKNQNLPGKPLHRAAHLVSSYLRGYPPFAGTLHDDGLDDPTESFVCQTATEEFV